MQAQKMSDLTLPSNLLFHIEVLRVFIADVDRGIHWDAMQATGLGLGILDFFVQLAKLTGLVLF